MKTKKIKLLRNKKALHYPTDEIHPVHNKELIEQISTELKLAIEQYKLNAISAPAIGHPYRMFAIKIGDEVRVMLNPMKVFESSEKFLSKETCSSLPDRKFEILRSNSIKVAYQNTDGDCFTGQFDGKAAFVVAHEIDHLDGILLSDFALEIDEEFENASAEDRAEIEAYYLQSLVEFGKKLNEDIQNDVDLKRMSDAIDFMTKVYTGEVEILPDSDDEKEVLDKIKILKGDINVQ